MAALFGEFYHFGAPLWRWANIHDIRHIAIIAEARGTLQFVLMLPRPTDVVPGHPIHQPRLKARLRVKTDRSLFARLGRYVSKRHDSSLIFRFEFGIALATPVTTTTLGAPRIFHEFPILGN